MSTTQGGPPGAERAVGDPSINRRAFLGTAASALGGGLLLAACGSGGSGGGTKTAAVAKGGGSVVIVDGGGTYHDALVSCCYDAYERESGVKVNSTSYDYTLGAIRAEESGAKEWDVIVLGQPISNGVAAELFQPVNYKIVNVPGMAQGGQFKYYVEDASFSHVVGYDTKKFKTPPKGWLDFWNTDTFPGARGLYNWPVGTLEIALLGDGVAPADLYPLDVKRALASIDKLRKKTMVRFYTSGTEQIEFFSQGLAPMVAAWGGRILTAAESGLPVDYQVDGALVNPSYLAILKTAPHPTQAVDYIKFKLQARISAANAEAAPGDVPGNTLAYKYIHDPKLAAKLPTNPALVSRTAGKINAPYWVANFDANLKTWQDYTSSL